jgi:uncharacterized protein YbjT (DUF2867 family)
LTWKSATINAIVARQYCPGMRVVVIGGTGHIGTYLVPSLVKAGHDTVVISRGSRRAYRDDPVWRDVEMVICDRGRPNRMAGSGRWSPRCGPTRRWT